MNSNVDASKTCDGEIFFALNDVRFNIFYQPQEAGLIYGMSDSANVKQFPWI